MYCSAKVEKDFRIESRLLLATFNFRENSNQGRENYLAVIRSRSVKKILFSVSYQAHSKPNMIKYFRLLSDH